VWPFRRHSTLEESGIFRGFTDWHCHILPGVDDGVRTMDESLEALRLYEECGVESVWLTPHVMEDIPNTTARLRERFAELRTVYQGTVKLHLAAENMLDTLFEERLEADDLLPIGEKGDCLLVETSCFNPPMGLLSLLKRILSKGYYPLLAHPERYQYMDGPDYRALKEAGIAFQLNLPSLAGMYGRAVQKKVASLLKAGMYDLTGSDLHAASVFTALLRARIDSRSRDRLWAHFRACPDAP
jgi:protein-tyrosine phosphatase